MTQAEIMQEMEQRGHVGQDLCDCFDGTVQVIEQTPHKWECPMIACLLGECTCEETVVLLAELDCEDYVGSAAWEENENL